MNINNTHFSFDWERPREEGSPKNPFPFQDRGINPERRGGAVPIPIPAATDTRPRQFGVLRPQIERPNKSSNTQPKKKISAQAISNKVVRAPAAPDQVIQANRIQALSQVEKFKQAINAELISLQSDEENALITLAEKETGTRVGTLNRLRGVRKKSSTEGTLAAEQFARYTKDRTSREKALYRCALIKILEHNFSIPEEILTFDLDSCLLGFRKNLPSKNLIQWYDFAYPDQDSDCEKMYYLCALEEFAPSIRDSEQTRAAKIYLSYIHQLLEKKLESIQIGSQEEELFRDTVRNFIIRFLDANQGCIDQVNSQLEDILFGLIGEQKGREGQESEFKFKAGLALCQYKAQLINHYTRTLFPEDDMADLEREVKKLIASRIGVKGSLFQMGAAYQCKDVEAKADTIYQAVMTRFNPALFLLDEIQAPHNSVPATCYLRSQLTQYISENVLFLDQLESNSDLCQALAMDPSGEITTTAVEGGALTFEGTIYYLEKAGILTLHRKLSASPILLTSFPPLDCRPNISPLRLTKSSPYLTTSPSLASKSPVRRLFSPSLNASPLPMSLPNIDMSPLLLARNSPEAQEGSRFIPEEGDGAEFIPEPDEEFTGFILDEGKGAEFIPEPDEGKGAEFVPIDLE